MDIQRRDISLTSNLVLCTRLVGCLQTIYSIKITLLQDRIALLPTGQITSEHQPGKISQKDLQLSRFQNLLQYWRMSAVISFRAVKTFQQHLWHLTAKVVPQALFSNQQQCTSRTEDIPGQQSACCLNNWAFLHTTKEQIWLRFWKTQISKDELEYGCHRLGGTKLLVELDLLQLYSSFFTTLVETWNSHSAYKDALLHLEAFKEVTGWNAKLRTNLIASARGDRYHQNNFQVVLSCQ